MQTILSVSTTASEDAFIAATQTGPVTEPAQTEPMSSEPALPNYLKDNDYIAVQEYIPGVKVELKYATEDNFTGKVIYDFQEAYLRLGTLKKLYAVQQELQSMGLSLKIWDAYRPVSAQWKLWEICPDSNFVSHPETGGRNHSRGSAVDVTLVDSSGMELEMPSGFDDFSEKANRDYTDTSDTAAVNAGLLQYIMEKHGFTSIHSEWWHFVDSTSYSVDELFVPIDYVWYYPVCDEFINLRDKPDVNALSLVQIPAGEQFRVLGWYGRYALAEYMGYRGYVNLDYISRNT